MQGLMQKKMSFYEYEAIYVLFIVSYFYDYQSLERVKSLFLMFYLDNI